MRHWAAENTDAVGQKVTKAAEAPRPAHAEIEPPQLRLTSPALPRAVRRISPKFAVLALVLGVGGGAYWWSSPVVVTSAMVVRGRAVDAVFATVSVEPRTRVQVRASLSGRITEISAKEGEQVHEGQALVRLAVPGLEAEVKRQQAERAATQQQASSSAPAIAALEARAAAIDAKLEQAKFEESRTRDLVTQQALPEAALVRDRATRASLEAELASTRAETRALRIETNGRDHVTLAQLDVATSKLQDAGLRATADATVLERLVDVGDDVVPGQALLRLADTTRLHLRCVVDEADALRVNVGQKVAVSLGAVPGKTLTGVVRGIRPEAEADGHSLVAEVELQDPPAGLRPGFTGDANILVAERSGALLVPARAVSSDSRVWLVRDGRAVRREVRLGIRSLDVAEILSGASAGDELLLDPPASVTEGTRVRPQPITDASFGR